MKVLMNLAVNHYENADVQSLPDGSSRHYYTSKQWWALSLNMRAVNVWLNVSGISAGAGVAAYWEYSWDGRNWLRAAAAVITQKTATGSYAGEHAVSSEIAPYGRLVVEVRNTANPPAAQTFATIDLRAHYKTDK